MELVLLFHASGVPAPKTSKSTGIDIQFASTVGLTPNFHHSTTLGLAICERLDLCIRLSHGGQAQKRVGETWQWREDGTKIRACPGMGPCSETQKGYSGK
eukprot:5688691-Amphidinium_carterae.1